MKSTPVLRAQCNTYSRTVKETGQLGSHLTAVMLNNCAPVSIFIQFRMDFGCKRMFMHISSLGHSLYTTSQSWKGAKLTPLKDFRPTVLFHPIPHS